MRAVDRLHKFSVPFYVITVLNRASLQYPDELFSFYVQNGISDVCFNIDEIEGLNVTSSFSTPDTEMLFTNFFSRFWDLRRQNGIITRIREFDDLLSYIFENTQRPLSNTMVEPFAYLNVDYLGNLSTFSPELLTTAHPTYGNFIFGNVANGDIARIWGDAKFLTAHTEIRAGVQRCSAECNYFKVCGGGSPSNKLWETGGFDATETLYCKYTVKLLTDLVLGKIVEEVYTANSNLTTGT
jgi:uncharacterized protein